MLTRELQGYLRAAKVFYGGGEKQKANSALAKALAIAKENRKDLLPHLDDLHRQWNPPLMNQLPDEIIDHVFSFIGRKDLFKCKATCRKWKNILAGNSILWREVVLVGTLQEIDAKWKKVCQTGRGLKSRSINIVPLGIRTEDTISWTETDLCKNFPSETLEEFGYTSIGAADGEKNRLVWKSVTTCSSLKVLTWAATTGKQSSYYIEGTPLAECRLRKLRFDIQRSSSFDDAFVYLLSNVKELHLQVSILDNTIWKMLYASRDSLIYLEIYQKTFHSSAINADTLPPITMKKLGSLHLEIDNEHPLHLICPKVTKLVLDGSANWDEQLIASCCANLVKLEVKPVKDEQTAQLLRLLFSKLPRCEYLTMHFGAAGSESNINSFWDTMREQGSTTDDVKMEEILPKLKSVKILGSDRYLTGGELVKFIQSRKTWNLAPIEKLCLESCENVQPESVTWLRSMVPTFLYGPLGVPDSETDDDLS
jgi:hypothetical protein